VILAIENANSIQRQKMLPSWKIRITSMGTVAVTNCQRAASRNLHDVGEVMREGNQEEEKSTPSNNFLACKPQSDERSRSMRCYLGKET